MDITQISKCEFEKAYNKYMPSKLEKFFFKYFSVNTKNTWVKWTVTAIMFIPFIFAFIGTITNASQHLIAVPTFIFCGLLACFAIPWLYVWTMHACRIKHIQKELGVNRFEYDFLVDKFYNEVTITKYMKNKVCE